ncbi:PH domain-containing protein [Flavobacterium sp.]|uniref:PH domain-containing protein n=1 Tax=Flavobacterium sp. TaxID=239 RepID=UPI0025D7DA06|nr:PH domain-containing protein [Flavobacterium sp.]
MNEQLKKFLNEEQDPKAIEKVMSKLSDLLMKNEEIGYIAVQKKPAITVLPDSIVVTNKRIIICQPKNLGLSMNFTDYSWDEIESTFVKEGILGSDFSFVTKTEISVTIEYIPKVQARKMYAFAKEQIDLLKGGSDLNINAAVEEVETEEVSSFAEIMPAQVPSFSGFSSMDTDKPLNELSSDELFEKLQNYKKLLDNGLILQGEYDALKKEILSYM